MTRFATCLLVAALLAFWGCAVGGLKLVPLRYDGGAGGVSSPGRPGPATTVGISGFRDVRKGMEAAYLGTRYIGGRTKEVFHVEGEDVATALTDLCAAYLQDAGFRCTRIADWEHTPDGLRYAGQGASLLVAGNIERLECFAVKKIGFTSMILDVRLVFFLGDPGTLQLRTVPYELRLTRQELTFSEQKLRLFLEESLLEALRTVLL